MTPPIIPSIAPSIEKPIPVNPMIENTSTIIPHTRVSCGLVFIIIAPTSTIIPATIGSKKNQPPANPELVHHPIPPPIIPPIGKICMFAKNNQYIILPNMIMMPDAKDNANAVEDIFSDIGTQKVTTLSDSITSLSMSFIVDIGHASNCMSLDLIQVPHAIIVPSSCFSLSN